MITKIYRIKGKFVLGSEIQKFTKELKGTSNENIEAKIYSHFGSKHGLNKSQINIESIEEINDGDVTDMVIKQIL